MKPTRDPRVDPQPGDIIRHVNMVLGPGPENRVEAVIGNLIAITYDSSGEVYWMPRERWCQPTTLTVRYDVLHVANHPTPGSWHVHRDNPDRCVTVIQVTPEQVMVRNELGKVEVIPTKEWETQWIEQ